MRIEEGNFYQQHKRKEDIVSLCQSKEILLKGMVFDNPKLAMRAMGNKIKESTIFPTVIFDVDDITHESFDVLIDRMNDFFKRNVKNYVQVFPEEIRQHGNWLDNINRLQEAAHNFGFNDFNSWFKSYQEKNPNIHALMPKSDIGFKLQQTLSHNGCNTVGYVTARHHSLAEITAASLHYDTYSPAPIVCISDGINPSDFKAEVFENEVIPYLSSGQRAVFIDDSISNVEAVCEVGRGSIVGIVPLVPRNAEKLNRLKDRTAPYIHGNLEQIIYGLHQRKII
jgi:hypothetical protein